MSAPSYVDFIARRQAKARRVGVTVARGDLHHSLKEFQRDIVIWAAQVGRPAVWADTGLGKTRMQLEWCRVMAETSLIVAPLAVTEQTSAEAALIHYWRTGVEYLEDLEREIAAPKITDHLADGTA